MLFAYENEEVDFTLQALSSIAYKAIERDTGARRTPRILEQVLRKPMLEIPSLSGIRHCIVSDFIIDGKAAARQWAGAN
jgi:ATP-dependent Clp protease ATP-binding subunit ClpX